jgi:hypothetical protein
LNQRRRIDKIAKRHYIPIRFTLRSIDAANDPGGEFWGILNLFRSRHCRSGGYKEKTNNTYGSERQ